MKFGWDPPKHDRNVRERGFGFDVAALIFEGDILLQVDDRRDYGEQRVRAIGEVDGVILSVVFTDRGDVRWIISARPASRKERQQWLQRR